MRYIGAALTGVWLILTGLMDLAGLRFDYSAEMMGVLAIVAGALLIARR